MQSGNYGSTEQLPFTLSKMLKSTTMNVFSRTTDKNKVVQPFSFFLKISELQEFLMFPQ